MRRSLLLGLTVLLGAVAQAGAGAPLASPRPRLRPASSVSVGPDARVAAPFSSPRPRLRPGEGAAGFAFKVRKVTVPVYYHARIRPRPRPGATPALTGRRLLDASGSAGPLRSPRPRARRRSVAILAPVRGRLRAIGGDPRILGRRLPPIAGRLRGCSVARPVRVSSVDGVALSPPAIMDLATARALASWVRNGVKPTIHRLGGGLASLRVVAGYSCRTRNNRKGARISEHGKGKAIDISAFRLVNGVSLKVKTGWRDPLQGKLLRRFHDEACGPFGTVLGPDADRYHRDHFHLDTARYRSGPYCR